MTSWLGFVLALGGVLAAVAWISAWLFRSTSAPFALKLALPAAAVSLACWAPLQVGAMMGLPVVTSLAALPDKVQLVAFLPHDEAKTVVLWLLADVEPRAYEVPLTKGLKQTLAQAREQLAGGRPVYLRKGKPGDGKGGEGEAKGKDGQSRTGSPSVTDLSDDFDPGYAIDDSALSQLPKKE